MNDLVLYLCDALRDIDLGLDDELIQIGCTIIGTAVPLMVLCAVLGVLVLSIMSIFNFLRGRKRDI